MSKPLDRKKLSAGFNEWLAVVENIPKLRDALEDAIRRERELRTVVLEGMTAGLTSLTPRERRVLTMIQGGKVNKEIAEELRISERTAKFHVTNILRKMRCTRRWELIGGLNFRSASDLSTSSTREPSPAAR